MLIQLLRKKYGLVGLEVVIGRRRANDKCEHFLVEWSEEEKWTYITKEGQGLLPSIVINHIIKQFCHL
jgi:hypothetical protein